jgi:hypothetical protein
MIASFEKKPANGGIPASAREPTTAVQYVMGMYLRKPPIRRRACS